MSPLAAGEDAHAEWLRRGRQVRLLALVVLVFFLGVTAAWAVGAVFAVRVLWRHGSDPVVAVFLGGWLLVWMMYPVAVIRGIGQAIAIRRGRSWPTPGMSSSRWSAGLFFGSCAVAWCAALAGLLRQGDVGGFVLGLAIPALFFALYFVKPNPDTFAPTAMPGIGLLPTGEGYHRYTLQGVGTLRVEGDWIGATAVAGGMQWRLRGSGVWSLGRKAIATDAAGNVIGEYRGRGQKLRWDYRQFRLRRVSQRRTLGWRALLAGGSRYALSDGTRVCAEIDENMRRAYRPINIEGHEAGALDPGLLLFVTFIAGWLDMRDRNNDGA